MDNGATGSEEHKKPARRISNTASEPKWGQSCRGWTSGPPKRILCAFSVGMLSAPEATKDHGLKCCLMAALGRINLSAVIVQG